MALPLAAQLTKRPTRVRAAARFRPLTAARRDRDPSLITDPVTGLVTTTKAYDVLRRNFIVANYNSLGAGGFGLALLRCRASQRNATQRRPAPRRATPAPSLPPCS